MSGGEFSPGFGDHVFDAERVPVRQLRARFGRRLAVGAPAEGGMARVGKAISGRGVCAAMQVQASLADLHVGAELVHREPLNGRYGDACSDVDQDGVLGGHQKEIGQIFACGVKSAA